jgi:hypothetical protein
LPEKRVSRLEPSGLVFDGHGPRYPENDRPETPHPE